MSFVPVHIAAGLVAIVAGAIALYSAKGGGLHRKSGTVFFWAMLAMTSSALALGLFRGQRFNASQGALTFYLVATAMLAVKPRFQAMRWLPVGAMLMAILIAGWDLSLGLEALSRPKGTLDGVPAPMIFLFGAIALLAAIGDLRFLTATITHPRHRIGRHLWRMSFGLWIATASFFLGQARFIPEPLRIMPLLALPVLLVLGTMIYWMVRVSIRHKPWTAAPRAKAALPA